jgi:hypothetical protein
MLTSSAYRSLSANARALLVELIMLYDGKNNGSLYLSVRDAADRIGVADLSAASKAFDALQKLGFIEVSREAHFSIKASHTSKARCWRLRWEAGPDRRPPSLAYMTAEPPAGSKERKRMERGQRALKRYRKQMDRGQFAVLESDSLYQFNTPVGDVFLHDGESN